MKLFPPSSLAFAFLVCVGAVDGKGGGTAPALQPDSDKDVDDTFAVGADGHFQRTPEVEDPSLYRFKKVPEAQLEKLAVLSPLKEDANDAGINVAAASGGVDTAELLRHTASAMELSGSSQYDGDACPATTPCMQGEKPQDMPALKAACKKCAKKSGSVMSIAINGYYVPAACQCNDNCMDAAIDWWDTWVTNVYKGDIDKEAFSDFISGMFRSLAKDGEKPEHKCHYCNQLELVNLKQCSKSDRNNIWYAVRLLRKPKEGSTIEDLTKFDDRKYAVIGAVLNFLFPEEGDPKDCSSCPKPTPAAQLQAES